MISETTSRTETLSLKKLSETLQNLCKKLEPLRSRRANSPQLRTALINIIPPAFNSSSETKAKFLNFTIQQFSKAITSLAKPGKRTPKNSTQPFSQIVLSLRPDLSESVRVTAVNPSMRQLKLRDETNDELLIFQQTTESAKVEQDIYNHYAFICSIGQWTFPEYSELSSNLRAFIGHSYTGEKCYMSERAVDLLYSKVPKSLDLLKYLINCVQPVDDHLFLIKILFMKLVPSNPNDIEGVYKTLTEAIQWLKPYLPDWSELERKGAVILPLKNYLDLTLDSSASEMAKTLNLPHVRESCEEQEQKNSKKITEPIERAEKQGNPFTDLGACGDDESDQNWDTKKVRCNCIIA
ncbi:hypothetical protein SOPP22_07345 [Shewanella sp. OPT22]|nr:hypothetical protein SOPP22_07345 [Shewanella sp. OPT22]